MSRRKRLWLGVAVGSRVAVVVLLLAAAYALALWQPVRQWYGDHDKLAHGLVFAAVFGLLAWAVPRARPWGAAVLAVALGGAVELHQMLLPGFTASWQDWGADAVGVAVALGVWWGVWLCWQWWLGWQWWRR